MYDQVDVRRQPLTLRFLHEWALMKELDDKREWDPKILSECQKTAIEAHVRLASHDIGYVPSSSPLRQLSDATGSRSSVCGHGLPTNPASIGIPTRRLRPIRMTRRLVL